VSLGEKNQSADKNPRETRRPARRRAKKNPPRDFRGFLPASTHEHELNGPASSDQAEDRNFASDSLAMIPQMLKKRQRTPEKTAPGGS